MPLARWIRRQKKKKNSMHITGACFSIFKTFALTLIVKYEHFISQAFSSHLYHKPGGVCFQRTHSNRTILTLALTPNWKKTPKYLFVNLKRLIQCKPPLHVNELTFKMHTSFWMLTAASDIQQPQRFLEFSPLSSASVLEAYWHVW